jgi:hypothetical protein
VEPLLLPLPPPLPSPLLLEPEGPPLLLPLPPPPKASAEDDGGLLHANRKTPNAHSDHVLLFAIDVLRSRAGGSPAFGHQSSTCHAA